MKNLFIFYCVFLSLVFYKVEVSAYEKEINGYSMDLKVSFDIKKKSIIVEADILLKFYDFDKVNVNLNQGAKDLSITLTKEEQPFPIRFTKKDNQPVDTIIVFSPPGLDPEKNYTLTFRYSLSFPGLPEEKKLYRSSDIQVDSFIDEKGSFLSEASNWYPIFPQFDYFQYQVHIKSMKGYEAISAGNQLYRKEKEDFIHTGYEFPYNATGIPLVVGPYQIRKKTIGQLNIYTYFYPDEEYLSRQYLDAVQGYINKYEKLIGPYPFKQFSVVSNMLPTGYGFPAFTLIGRTVLRLPFIVKTSLGHEILHNWWGNGVYIDYEKGNWAEGLTTYMADYAYKAQKGPKEAAAARREVILNYLSYVNEGNLVPVTQFVSRTESYLKAIGYDKVSMIFHMLKIRLGEDVFYKAVKKFYKDFQFKTASWKDIQNVFAQVSTKSLDRFFRVWVKETDLPMLALKDVHLSKQKSSGKYKLSFILEQINNDFFPLDIQVDVQFDNRKKESSFVFLDQKSKKFDYLFDKKPILLKIDNGIHIFRKLYEEEIPPTLNAVMGSPKSLVVMKGDEGKGFKNAYESVLERIMEYPYTISSEVKNSLFDQYDTFIFLGKPDFSVLTKFILNDGQWRWDNRLSKFIIGKEAYPKENETVFMTAKLKQNLKKQVLFIYGDSAESITAAIRPVPHYGRYGYLVFRWGKNTAKGKWDVLSSPLTHTFFKN